MKELRGIIPSVVSAKNNYANPVVLKLASEASPNRQRTLGVITKPDTLIAGSKSQAFHVCPARNHDMEIRLGWHVLKNVDSETGVWTLVNRAVQEEKCFFIRDIGRTASVALRCRQVARHAQQGPTLTNRSRTT